MENIEQEKKEPKPWEIQQNICVETRKFDRWIDAHDAYHDIIGDSHGYSKIKISRHGPRRSNSGQFFELRLFVPIERKQEKEKKGRRRKKSSKNDE